MQTASPASKPAAEASKETAPRKRIPMSTPTRKLETPELPGFHLYWFLDGNVPRAIQAGYEHVKTDEMSLTQVNAATSRSISGNQDLGTNVRIVGGVGSNGEAEYLNLMKIRIEWYQEDRKQLEAQNARIMQAIFNKEFIAGSEQLAESDKGHRYVKTALFNRPTRKGDV